MENKSEEKIEKEVALSFIYASAGKVSFSSFGTTRPNLLVDKVKKIKEEEIDIDYLICFFESYKLKNKKDKDKNEGIDIIINNLKLSKFK